MGVIADLMIKIGSDTSGLTKEFSTITRESGKIVTRLGKIGAVGGLIVKATFEGIAARVPTQYFII